MDQNTLNVGDKIIDYEKIYIITKIENNQIFYQPFNIDKSSKTSYQCSIPLNNLSLACIRSLMTKTEIESFLKKLSHEESINLPPRQKNKYNNNYFKEILFLNNPIKTGRMLIHLSKIKNETKLSRTDQTIYDQALSRLADEISIVTGDSFGVAKEKIIQAITRHSL
jgi:RNA polymerase-interacting CarD/CdnL/TRCF family regulator